MQLVFDVDKRSIIWERGVKNKEKERFLKISKKGFKVILQQIKEVCYDEEMKKEEDIWLVLDCRCVFLDALVKCCIHIILLSHGQERHINFHDINSSESVKEKEREVI